MDVQVTHNGNNITQYVVRYDREHKICTGIGMLEMEVSNSYSGSFDPWDKIIIFENGRKSGQYYVNSSSEAQPSISTQVVAQDASKRLSDYFISDYYMVDYPSYSSFWIGYFLDEVGIKYTIVSPDPGTLLNNNTALGLMTAYEQIMYLLQMNGWYITFDYNDRAIIGKLTTDFGVTTGSFGNRDIIEIDCIKSDNMLRNRVVVWGKGDPERGRWVFADVYKPTKWDYDRKDRRTIVIANNNVRKTSDAFWLANKALLEFSKITIEKHITLAGAKNLLVGNIVTIRNKTFTGKGKITTFGTSMSKDGLVTNISLDERCPRLFAFWDMGGFVYVSTFGSGVWRKHIMPAWSGGSTTGSGLIGFASGIYNPSGWYDYSSGLMGDDLKVTDLHVNAGMLACVTASGKAFYSLEDEHPWSGVVMSGFTVSISGALVTTGSGYYDDTVYSGLMTRACIIDRDTNFIRYAVDTRSGENLGDFLMETDPLNSVFDFFSYYVGSGYFLSSGVVESGMRSWVVDVNGYDGTISGVYPVGISGDYDFYIYDIENDGSHDYVEVMTFGSGSIPVDLTTCIIDKVPVNSPSFNSGTNATFSFLASDERMRSFIPFSGYPIPELQNINKLTVNYGFGASSDTIFAINDSSPAGPGLIAFCDVSSSQWRMNVAKFDVDFAGNITQVLFTSSTSVVHGGGITPQNKVIAVKSISPFVFRYVFYSQNLGVFYYDYNYVINSTSSRVVIPDSIFPEKEDCYRLDFSRFSFDQQTVGNKIYTLYALKDDSIFGFELKLKIVDFFGGGVETRTIYKKQGNGIDDGEISYRTPYASLFPYDEDDVLIIVPYLETVWYVPEFTNDHYARHRLRRIVAKGSGSKGDSFLYDWFIETGKQYLLSNPMADWDGVFMSALSGETRFKKYRLKNDKIVFKYAIGDEDANCITYTDSFFSVVPSAGKNSSNVDLYTDIDLYRHYQDRHGVGYDTANSKFALINVDTYETIGHINHPIGYTLESISGFDSFNGDIFFKALNSFTGVREIISISPMSGSITRRMTSIVPGSPSRELMYGKFILTGTTTITITMLSPTAYGKFPYYLVLQRDNYDFRVVKSGLFRDRLDISNYAPLVTMDRRVSSTELYYISLDNSVLAVMNPTLSGYNLDGTTMSGGAFNLGIIADDFRYCGVDNSENVESGYNSFIYVTFSGQLGRMDMDVFDSLSGVFLSSSGYMTKVETSNYSFPDQYLFVALSGYGSNVDDEVVDFTTAAGWGFLQKNPASGIVTESGSWVDYSSGFPQSRVTMIRLDDII